MLCPTKWRALSSSKPIWQAVVRVGGDLQMLKAFVASGFPVIVEKGFEGARFDGWMGHYQVVNGYDDAAGIFIVQDSYKGPNLAVTLRQSLSTVAGFQLHLSDGYPPESRDQVLEVLGLQAYDNYNTRYALQKARRETTALLAGTSFLPGLTRAPTWLPAGLQRRGDGYRCCFRQLLRTPQGRTSLAHAVVPDRTLFCLLLHRALPGCDQPGNHDVGSNQRANPGRKLLLARQGTAGHRRYMMAPLPIFARAWKSIRFHPQPGAIGDWG